MLGWEDLRMKRKRHSPEQIIRKLREADGMLSEGNFLDTAREAFQGK